MQIDFHTLANEYDTPLYVYDFDTIKQRYHILKDAFSGSKSLINYAIKANSNLSVISSLAKLGAGADCVSIGEVRRALCAGVDKYKIIFSGVGKKDEEMQEALKADILLLNLESEAEMKRLEIVAKSQSKVARISIRVNPNIDPKTHPYISTGLDENKFGVDIDTAKRMYLYAKKSQYLEPIGIHFHIGSQLTQLSPIQEACEIVADLTKTLKAIDVNIRFFDIGGGLGVTYSDETPIDIEAYIQTILMATKGLDVTILCEPGRWLVAQSGYLVTRVLYEKKHQNKRFVIVDGAMNDLLRPSLYQAYHRIEAIGKDGEQTPADVVGPICESGDFLGKHILLPPLEHNDILVIHTVGAYGFSMSSNYNSRNKSAEVAIENNSHRIIRKRETFENLIELELPYLQRSGNDT